MTKYYKLEELKKTIANTFISRIKLLVLRNKIFQLKQWLLKSERFRTGNA